MSQTGEISASIEHDKAHPPRYLDARGHEWNGLGDLPDWLVAAKNAGVNRDFFRIETEVAAAKPVEDQPAITRLVDSRQLDLFDAMYPARYRTVRANVRHARGEHGSLRHFWRIGVGNR